MRPTREAGSAQGAGATAVRPDVTAQLVASLRDRLTSLVVEADRAECEIAEVAVAAYPGGFRPSSTVVLRGKRCSGRGEHVGWTRAEHEGFAARIRGFRLPPRTTVAEASRQIAERLVHPYDRAALEAATIDLALRQSGSSLAALARAPARPVRYVVSFDRCADPVARARREIAGAPAVELKIDVEPGWDADVLRALDRLGCVRILDFKQSGDPAQHERAHRWLPAAWLEDPLPGPEPWSPSLMRRWSVDGPVTSAAALAALPRRPAAANVKPARMGGVLEALDCIEACVRQGLAFYLGGMFEIGVGRAQLHALASLFCPDAPNDVAPIALGDAPPPRPARIAPRSAAGFAGP